VISNHGTVAQLSIGARNIFRVPSAQETIMARSTVPSQNLWQLTPRRQPYWSTETALPWAIAHSLISAPFGLRIWRGCRPGEETRSHAAPDAG
jgi:hypothetical protein